MARFKEGDKVRWRTFGDETFTVVSGPITAIREWPYSGGIAYVVQRRLSNGGTHTITLGEAELAPAPKPFLPSGSDRYVWIRTELDSIGNMHVCGQAYTARGLPDHWQNVIKIDGQTGELSWAKGGPNG